MALPFVCPVCNRFDAEGIFGHASNRCKPASNGASNNASNGQVESNSDNGKPANACIESGGNRGRDSIVPAKPRQAVVTEKPPVTTKQRWDREKYNAYQKELMRKRRST